MRNTVKSGLYFSPRGGCEQALINLINSAKLTIDVCIFNFTSKPIANALLAAAIKRKVIRVIIGTEGIVEYGSVIPLLKAGGIAIYHDTKHHLMHSKYIIVDARNIAFGSYNYTFEAEHGNAEVLSINHNYKDAIAFIKDFVLHMNHSTLVTNGEPNGN